MQMNMTAAQKGATTADADFEVLEASFRRQGFYEKRPLRVIVELAVNLLLVLGGIAVFVASDQPVARIVAMLASTYGLVGVASNSHTSSHHGTSDNWWLDESLTYLGFSFVFGVSTTYWKHHHLERHHPNTNVVGIDYDADLAPWFLLNRADIERSRGPPGSTIGCSGCSFRSRSRSISSASN
jgi:fatty acid desaturase